MISEDTAAAYVDRLGAAFAAGDVEAALAAFVPGDAAMYVGSEAGECAAGQDDLRALLANLFARDERYSWRCESVVVAASATDVAVFAEAKLVVLPAGEVIPYRITGILVPDDGGWAWRLFAGSEPAV